MPHRIQYVLAHHTKIVAASGALFLAGLIAWSCEAFSLWAVVATFLALPLGAILATLIFCPPLSKFAAYLNGAPFREGDHVRLLAGPHRGRILRIYEVWASRCQVRVELGEKERSEIKDVFWYTDVCREKGIATIILTPTGFTVERIGKIVSQVSWSDVKEIFAFKRDVFAYDLICLGFRVKEDDTFWEVDEQCIGYKELLKELEQQFQGFRTDWFAQVAHPAFALNRTTLWGKPRTDLNEEME